MDIPVGAIVASRYKVLRELGRGGMGAVYLVEHVNTGDHAALKVMLGTGHIDTESLERFKREARAPAKIKSEHVVKVLDADSAPELGGAPFLVMELLQGTDLQKLVRQRGRLSPKEVFDYLRQASVALDKSHALGIVHRDLKPENIYLHTREDRSVCVKILDFGISKILPQASASAMPMTALGAVMGTPLFMSPEQARGAVQHIGPQTDVWAIGLIAVHLLTGEHYWGQPRNLTELMTSIIRCELYPPSRRWPWLPRSFDAWLLRSCAREPTQRFATVGEQVAALGQALGLEQAVAFDATAAAPSNQPASLPMTLPMVSSPAPWSGAPAYTPVVGASTTAAGAMSAHAPLEARPEGRASPLLAALVALSLFVLVGGLGLAAVVVLRRPAPIPVAAVAPAPSISVAPAPTPEDTIPPLTSAPQPKPAVSAPRPKPTTQAPSTSASPPPSSTPSSSRPSPAQLACIKDCEDECNGDPAENPVNCEKKCKGQCSTVK